MSILLVCADARNIPLPDNSVQCVVTSPPYWGLRKYAGEQAIEWDGWRGAYGLEPTIEMYVEHTVEILGEIRRALRPDGVVFWNIGDCYNAYNGGAGPSSTISRTQSRERPSLPSGYGLRSTSLKPKDLCLIPSRIALAAQTDGWWVRSMIVWAKPNPMPESVTDRPTDAYEHIVMLTKSQRYYWDADAVREPHKEVSLKRIERPLHHRHPPDIGVGIPPVDTERMGERFCHPNGRNIRNVWTFPTQPYSGAHFATFPEELPRRCIKAASRQGDLVLDPFGGSGTTGRVAIELGRRAVLLDLAYTHDYGPLAKKRTTNVQISLDTGSTLR